MPGPSRLPAFRADHAPAGDILALTGARLFDGSGAAPREGVTVIVEGGRVAHVGSAGDGVPDTAAVVDLAGRTLMPGLIDAHAHVSMLEFSSHAPTRPKGTEPLRDDLPGHLAAAGLRRALRMGVTTIRDVGAYGDVLLGVRQAMRYGAFAGPRLLLCGRIVSPTAPGGRFFPGMYREADGVDDVRRAVREQIRAGADFVKIMSTGARTVELEDPDPAQVTRQEMATFVEEAHRLGYRAAAHCEGLAGTELAIEEGVDTIEHGFHLHRRPDLLERMASRRAVLVPTIEFLHNLVDSGCWTQPLVEQGEHNIAEADATLGAARREGVLLAVGSDAVDVDRGFAAELVRLVAHGLPAAAALVAATSGGANALGIDSEVGVVAAGKRADLLVVQGDPLADPKLLADPARVWLVLRNGEPVAGALLERRLAQPALHSLSF
jgi:imidazolonepropionase-like amidohydrolase